MRNSSFVEAEFDNATASYHETLGREVIRTRCIPEQLTAPSGGSLHSTVEDMARWMAFNLSGGTVQGRQLIQLQTLQEIHSPQIPVGKELCGPSAEAVYAMGWFVDTYNGWPRISHGGYMHDVNSEVALFPRQGLGFVAFTNMGCQRLARLLIEHTFDLIMDRQPVMSFAERIAQYEKGVVETRERNANVKRVADTSPSHPLGDYVGVYIHPAYGRIEIQLGEAGLIFKRNRLVVPLQHWHYDAWIAADTDLFLIHIPHPFERASRFLFETNVDGEIAALSLLVEPALGPSRFEKQARPQ
jgi:hypothetical protein